jgi:hypothetical protein
VQSADRLAAYLAGELTADERQALEADLARDTGLRADLQAMQRADAALAVEAPSALPDGARDRLLAALEPTFAEELGGDASAATATASPGIDELAARRRAVDRRSWVTALGGIAAALVAVAIIGPVLSGTGGDDEGGVATTAADDGQLESAPAESSDEGVSQFAAPVGPTLLGSERTIDTDGAQQLLEAGELDAVIAQGLSPDDARGLGASWAAAFGSAPGATDDALAGDRLLGEEAEDTSAGAGEAADDAETPELEQDRATTSTLPEAALEFGVADLQTLGDVDEQARADVARCLATLTAGGPVLIPALAELVTFAGEPAVAFALIGLAPDDTVTRREVWILEREGCEVRYLRQG